MKRGLRDINGKGVLAGLTEHLRNPVSSMVDESGATIPCEGKLLLPRASTSTDLVGGIHPAKSGSVSRKPSYLLLFGELPDEAAA